ncbi:dTDP-4-dehydrorhamnose reductase [Planktothrix serta PCC 8927]|uniref:dTDP-4-dehydrorhamnose reductase n=1 Tax=Planktothrix serta PCC 8927 TaxID=671068 RepID=A0A7Z9DX47_9CYAN|nr:NAD(P)-dependent oxidoreductase [Planktothrix serta]VXD16041.1 dTDP-4-dehydrorhamnose reductase [Planktothrix serta PCC 8927]
MNKLLITGASGFLGWHLCHIAQTEWQVYGISHSKIIDLPNINMIKADLTDFQALKNLFQQIKPDAVIHAAAQSQPNFCQQYPELSYQINVRVSLEIADLCAELNIPCVFTSTDLVFNGLNAPYQETDPVCPVSYYGEQKVLAEQGILERYPRTAICRMSLMFGDVPDHATSFIQPFIQTLKQGKELNLFIDEFRTPVSGTTAAKGLLLALKTTPEILHLGGKERLSRYEFGKLMAEVLELPSHLIKPCSQGDIKMSAPRPPDVSLDSSKAFNLGYKYLSIREELQQLILKL